MTSNNSSILSHFGASMLRWQNFKSFAAKEFVVESVVNFEIVCFANGQKMEEID